MHMEGLTVSSSFSYSLVKLSIPTFNHMCALNGDVLLLLAAYMSSPCHIELTLSEKEEPVKKEVGSLVKVRSVNYRKYDLLSVLCRHACF